MSAGQLKFVAAVLVLPLALGPQLAGAVWDDKVEFFLQREWTRDDNVFRLSDEVDSESVIGSSERSDTFHTTTVGVEWDLPVSRQRFSGELAFDQVRFDRFSELDLNGHRGNLLWDWVVGDRWSGDLSFSRSRVLASLANLQGGVQVNSPNFLTIAESAGNARYKLTERWHVIAAASRTQHDNSSEDSRISDATISGSEFALRYVTPQGSEFGVSIAARDASLPVAQAVNGELIDNSYDQTLLSAMADWAITADSQLRASVGTVERQHRDVPERDYDGNVYSLAYNWRATDTLSLALERRKGVSPYEQVNVGFVLLDSLTLRGHWRITDKIALTVSRIDGDREYRGVPQLALPGREPRKEDAAMTNLELSYEALDFIRLGLGWRSDSRRSSVPLGDYDANVLTFRIRGHF